MGNGEPLVPQLTQHRAANLNVYQHRARCPPPVAPAADSESIQITSTPRSVSDGPSIASPSSSGDADVAASRDDTVLELSEVSSLAPSTPPPNPDMVVVHDTRCVQYSIRIAIALNSDHRLAAIPHQAKLMSPSPSRRALPHLTRLLPRKPSPPRSGIRMFVSARTTRSPRK